MINIKRINIVKLLPLIVSFVILFLTIGFSAFTSTGTVKNPEVLVRAQADIRLTGAIAQNPVDSGISNYEEYNVGNMSSAVNLPNATSKITYKVEVTNFGNVNMILKEITGLPENLKYTLDNYQLKEVICDDVDSSKCTLGAKKTIYITVSYQTNAYDASETTFPFTLNFSFESTDKVAKIDNTYYDTLQEAIDDVKTNDETTIVLLKDASEIITIPKNRNMILNLQNYILSNVGNNPVINNNGTLSILNGTITTNAPANGAVNNQATGNLTIDGTSIIVTGGRQALYNNKGIATIKGNAYLISGATERAAAQNLSGGTLYIKSGTIISTGSSAVNNAGTMTIGEKDDNIDENNPVMQGEVYGITSTTNYSFYNGTAKGITKALNNNAYVTDIENNYSLANSEETIDGKLYKTSFLGITITVTFNPNGGTLSDRTKNVVSGKKIGLLPTPTRSGYQFIGWFTDPNGGDQIDTNTIITAPITFHAHWIKSDVAEVNGTRYDSLQGAIDAVPNNTQTTITLLRSIAENVVIPQGKNIIFDFQNYTINNNTTDSIIKNSGIITISNGTLKSTNAVAATIDVLPGGKAIITGGSIIATGTRQALYNDNGIVEISGNAYLSSTASGKPTGSSMGRSTVQNLAGGTITITGGTIVGTVQQAVSNEGILNIGTKDTNIDTTTPVIIGETCGLKTAGTFNFYDGIIKGITGGISGSINDQETNAQIHHGSETINNKTYITDYLST